MFTAYRKRNILRILKVATESNKYISYIMLEIFDYNVVSQVPAHGTTNDLDMKTGKALNKELPKHTYISTQTLATQRYFRT